MAPTEMKQPSSPLSCPQPSTPPSSPNLPSSKNVFLLNSRQVVHAVKAVLTTLRIDPTLQASAQPTIEYLEQDVIKNIGAQLSISARNSATPGTLASGICELKDVVTDASMLEFKTVDELWDGKAHKYAILESIKPVGEVTGLDQYVFVVRRRVEKKSKVTTCFIDVKSELLRDLLRGVLKDVKGISLSETMLSVEQNLLYTLLPKLESCLSWNEIDPLNQLGTSHLGLLVAYLKREYAGDTEYNFGEEKRTMTGIKYWSLDCCYLDFNGEDLGLFPIDLKIAKFRGAKHINTWPAFPLQYHTEPTSIRADILRCGQKFMYLRGAYHRYSNGSAFYMRDGEPVKMRVDGRIMVDAACFRKMNPNYFRSKAIELDHGFDFLAPCESLDYTSFDEASSEASSNDTSTATYFELESKASFDQLEGSVVEQTETDENLLICCPTVPGFSLKDKLWVEFAVADIEEIKWSTVPFDCLTLPDEQRETIMAVTESVTEDRTSRKPHPEFDDFVDGKGRGIMVLLHGNPGVGKTLTAEAIAEHRKKPMYSISAGDLPTDAGRLESQLSKIYQVAKHWDAILLLDEADVFLEARAPKDISRNGVVSVFLRTMEYCQGTMLLTTNRVTEFDPAALSRIHLKVKYNDLNSRAKSEIWTNQLARACTFYGAPSISADELKCLSNTHLNGREIKNTVAIARKVAIKQESKVLFSHLKQAVAASKEFLREFNGSDYVGSIFL